MINTKSQWSIRDHLVGQLASATADLSWPSWQGSRRTRPRRRRQCRREAASRSSSASWSDPSRRGRRSRSIGRSSNTWSGCGCGQRDSAQGQGGRQTGKVPLCVNC